MNTNTTQLRDKFAPFCRSRKMTRLIVLGLLALAGAA